MISRNPAAMLNAGGALLFGALALANLHLPFPDALSQKGQTAKVSTLAPLTGESGSDMQPNPGLNSSELEALTSTSGPGATPHIKRAPGLPRTRFSTPTAAGSSGENLTGTLEKEPKAETPAVLADAPAQPVSVQPTPVQNFGGMISANPFADPGLPPPPPLPAAIPLPKSMGLPSTTSSVKKPEPQKSLNYKPGMAETPAPTPSPLIEKRAAEPSERPRSTQPPTPSYTLSAATGEQAWVREGNDQTLTVKVGDSLPGYGRITAITPDKVVFDTGRTLTLPSKSDLE